MDDHADDVERLEALCKELGVQDIAESEKHGLISQVVKTHYSYSLEIDTCVGTRIDYLNNDWTIFDVQRRFLRMHFRGLFTCDNAGVDNTILEVVRRYGGNVEARSSREYMDNGEGGAPRLVYTPPAPYSRDKCEAMIKKKIRELRLVNPS